MSSMYVTYVRTFLGTYNGGGLDRKISMAENLTLTVHFKCYFRMGNQSVIYEYT